MSAPNEYPWVFQRDDIDLLEDELDDLYTTFAQVGSLMYQEQEILREQIETEEASDQALARRLGLDEQKPRAQTLSSGREDATFEDVVSAWQKAPLPIQTHPFYQQAKAWMKEVKPMARQQYEGGGPTTMEWFRIYANSNLVPLKIFWALCEEGKEDETGWQCAQEEYRLAQIYLLRILESLERAHSSWDLQEDVQRVRNQGIELERILSGLLTRPQRRS